MAFAGANTKHGITGINVTPLIDVLLVLLIIFMVIVPVTSRGLNSAVPQPPNRVQTDRQDFVVVQVVAGADGRVAYLLNQAPVAKADLQSRLTALFNARQNKVVFVKADRSIQYASVAEVIDFAHAAQVDTVALITPGVDGGR